MGFEVGNAERVLAYRLLWGRGCSRDVGRAIELLRSAGAKGATSALLGLGKIFFDGEIVARNFEESYACHRMAYELNRDSLAASTATALMLLEGTGVNPDEAQGARILAHAISLYAAISDRTWVRPRFDQEACVREVMAARRLADGQTAALPLARRYLDWMVRLGVAQAERVLDRCGGPVPRRQPRWELGLSRVLPDKFKADIWWVTSPEPDRRRPLGQVERLPNRRWIATTDEGVPVGETFESARDAVVALAAAVGCYVPYVDPLTERLKRRGMDAPPGA